MKIISLNTWAGVVINPLLDFLANNADVDVFCLQEIYRDAAGKDEPHPTLDMKLDLYERIENRLKETHVGYFRPVYKDCYGLAMFVRKGVAVAEEGDVIIYTNTEPEGRGRHSRNLQYIRVQTDGGLLTIANVHGLWNGQGKTDTDDRIEQSQHIHTFVKNCSSPLVLMGDFNLNPDTQSLAIAGEGLRDLIGEYGVTSTRTSLHTRENKYADYAFVSPEISVKSFRVLPDEVSDHAALELVIN